MKTAQSTQPQSLSLEEQLVGVNAKTGIYPAARPWSGGHKHILGKESHCYHVMSRTCGGEIWFDDVEEALRHIIWRVRPSSPASIPPMRTPVEWAVGSWLSQKNA